MKWGVKIHLDSVPLISEVMNLSRMGIVPAGSHRNRAFRENFLIGADKVEPALMDTLFDPQTSGGLLIAIKREEAGNFVARLREKRGKGSGPYRGVY